MNTQANIESTGSPFSLQEYEALQTLRASYATSHGLFTAQEMACLRFVRWLIHSPEWNRAMDCLEIEQEDPEWTPGSIS